MHPALINEIARYHQADLLREAARERLAREAIRTREGTGAAGRAGACARPSGRRSDGSAALPGS